MTIGRANQANSRERNSKRHCVDSQRMPNSDVPEQDVGPVATVYIAGEVDDESDTSSIEVSQPELTGVVVGGIVTLLNQTGAKAWITFLQER